MLNENHGLLRPARTYDYGGIIPFVIRNPSGIWTPYLPDGERQSNANVDTMACVSYSIKHCIETQETFLTGQRIRYSARWLAKKSGTTPSGNYFVSVANTIKLYGLVRYESWPDPLNYTWATYYADPTPEQEAMLLAEGKEWLKTHKFESEFLTTDLPTILQHIKQGPLQIGLPGHAVEDFYTEQEIVNYFDTYIPFQKQTSRSSLTDVYKNVLTMKLMRLVNDKGTYYLVGDKGKIGLADIGALNDIKAIESAEETGDTTGIPQVGIFETGLTYHK